MRFGFALGVPAGAGLYVGGGWLLVVGASVFVLVFLTVIYVLQGVRQ